MTDRTIHSTNSSNDSVIKSINSKYYSTEKKLSRGFLPFQN